VVAAQIGDVRLSIESKAAWARSLDSQSTTAEGHVSNASESRHSLPPEYLSRRAKSQHRERGL